MDLTTVTLASPRLTLESFRREDAPDAFAALTPAICRHLPFYPSPSLQDFARTWLVWQGDMASGRQIVLSVRRKNGRGFVGLAGLHALHRNQPEFGIWISEGEQAKGFGLEIATRVIGWGGAALGYPFVHYHVADANIPSQRIAIQLGGEIVGTGILRKAAGDERPLTIYRVATTPLLRAWSPS